MTLLALLGCGMGTFTTDDGPDQVRTALYFVPDSALALQLYGARQAYVLLANSTLPCWPDTEDDDPATPPTDTESRYWDAQAATLFAREGALVVAFSVALGPEEDWLGRYAVRTDAWDSAAMAGYVAEDGRVASGAWFQVLEAEVDEGSGLDYALTGGVEVVEEAHDVGVGAPAWVDVSRKDTALEGTFDLTPAPLSGKFQAEYCDNLALLGDLYTRLALLAIADEAGEREDGDEGEIVAEDAR